MQGYEMGHQGGLSCWACRREGQRDPNNGGGPGCPPGGDGRNSTHSQACGACLSSHLLWRPRQEHHKFKAGLGNLARSHFKNEMERKTRKGVVCHKAQWEKTCLIGTGPWVQVPVVKKPKPKQIEEFHRFRINIKPSIR